VTYWPVETTIDTAGRQWATPCDWKGSSDLQCLANMNGFAILPPRDGPYPAQTVVEILQTSR
jgi:molybdopterin biosynthesis enzyme